MSIPSPVELREAAKRYIELGWQVVPVRGKQPRGRWKHAQPWHKIDPWFDDPQTTGLAVVLGSRSGNLIARDFDEETSYFRWCAQYPELARTLPTAQTPRPGRHVFARSASPCPTQRFSDGELRGEGAIIVLPPSLHKTGERYQWLIEPFAEIPIIEPSTLIGTAEQISQKRSSTTKSPPTPTTHNKHKHHNTHMACVNSDKELFIVSAIEQTQPTKFGQRNRRIFDFARHLRKQFDADADPETFRPHVEAWHQKALPNIRTKDFDETWGDFVHAWEKIRRPAGASLDTIKHLAMEDSFTLGLGDLNLDRVARFFRAAAICHAEHESFYLSYRTIAPYVGLSHVACREIARKLIALGLVLEVEKGSVGTRGKATVWRWTGSLDESIGCPTESAGPYFAPPPQQTPHQPATTNDSDWHWP